MNQVTQSINKSIKQVNMKSITENVTKMTRVKRAMEGKFPEEKKKIWEKTVSQQVKERQMKKKMWQRDRSMARSMPIFEEQKFIELDTAQVQVNEWMDMSYSCSCGVDDPYDYLICHCRDCGGHPSKYCYNCEGRLNQSFHQKKKEPSVIIQNITQMHPWGLVTISAEYMVPPIPAKTVEEYAEDMKQEEDNLKRSDWFSKNQDKIMVSIGLIKSSNPSKIKKGKKMALTLLGDSEELKKYYTYYFMFYEDILYDPFFMGY